VGTTWYNYNKPEMGIWRRSSGEFPRYISCDHSSKDFGP
jgi:hypothetical protein